MTEYFRFAYPQLFFLLIPVALWGLWAWRKKPSACVHSDAALLASLAGRGALLRARLPLILRLLALILLVTVAARPQTYNISREVSSPGVDIVMALDTSGSMQGMDFTLKGRPVDRLTAVKKVVADFIKKRPHDRIGLVVFGSHAFTQSPLTLDDGLLLGLVENLEVGMAGETTAIGDALAVAGKRIKEVPAPTKIVILLTDGRQNAGEVQPSEAAGALAALGIKIYTIGVGTRGRVPFSVNGIFGKQTVYRNVEMDEEALMEIAKIGNGKYFHAGNTETLEDIYDQIDRLEKTEIKVKQFFHFKELFMAFLATALLLLLAEIVFFRMGALP